MSAGDVTMCVRKNADAVRDLRRAARGFDELAVMTERLTPEEYARYRTIAAATLESADNAAMLANIGDRRPEVLVENAHQERAELDDAPPPASTFATLPAEVDEETSGEFWPDLDDREPPLWRRLLGVGS